MATTPINLPSRTEIQIDQPWAQQVAPGATTLAVYATVVSMDGDTLTGVSSPAATDVAIYRTLMKGGHASLSPASATLTLPPHQPLLMGPHATQIRLTGLKQAVAVGDMLTVTLSFARAGTLSIEIPVESSTAIGPSP